MKLLATMVGVLVLVAACGDDAPVATGDDGGARPTIEGEYLAVEVTEDGEPRPLVEGTELTLRLEGGRLSASAGCNSIGGPYEIVDGVLVVDELAMTEMGCDPPRHEQDEWLAGVLASGPEMVPVEEGFVLRSGSTSIDFRDHSFVRPDVDLVGTTWVVDGFIAGSGPDGTVTNQAGNMGRIVLGEDGTVSGNDGCNDFGFAEAPTPDAGDETLVLRHDVDGDEITFDGAPVSTLRGCDDVDVEHFWAVLTGTVGWEIDGDRLTLTAPDGRGVTYQAADQ